MLWVQRYLELCQSKHCLVKLINPTCRVISSLFVDLHYHFSLKPEKQVMVEVNNEICGLWESFMFGPANKGKIPAHIMPHKAVHKWRDERCGSMPECMGIHLKHIQPSRGKVTDLQKC